METFKTRLTFQVKIKVVFMIENKNSISGAEINVFISKENFPDLFQVLKGFRQRVLKRLKYQFSFIIGTEGTEFSLTGKIHRSVVIHLYMPDFRAVGKRISSPGSAIVDQ